MDSVYSTHMPSSMPPDIQSVPLLYCSTPQTAVSPEQVRQNSSLSPLWILDGRSRVQDALIEAGLMTGRLITTGPRPYYLPPVLLVTDNISLADVDLPSSLQLQRDMLISSLLAYDSNGSRMLGGTSWRKAVDMGYRINLVTPPPEGAGSLVLQHLTLTNLVRMPLAGATSNQSYALPLWAFTPASNRSALQLDSVGLVLPCEEYSIMYHAAARGRQWKTMASPLLAALELLLPAEPPSAARIYLSEYRGFGVNATRLTLVPECNFDPAALQELGPQELPVAEAVAQDSAPATNVVMIAAVAAAVGAVVTLLATSAVLVYVCKRRKPACAGDGHAAQPDAGGVRVLVKGDVTDSSHHTAVGGLRREGCEAAGPETESAAVSGDTAAAGLCEAWPRPGSGGTDSGTSAGTEQGGASAEQQVATGKKASTAVSCSKKHPRHQVEALAQELAQGLEEEHGGITLLDPIGKGGYGIVYQALWRNLEVAVKMVWFTEDDASRSTGSGAHRRAVVEAAVCTSVQQPYVITTYHYAITQVERDGRIPIPSSLHASSSPVWRLSLVQELCQASLHEALVCRVLHEPATKKPHMHLVLDLLLQVASGMSYLHHKNIIHGDLKPENILLKYDLSATFHVAAKITDFGLCTALQKGASRAVGIRDGTPFYVAPEIVKLGLTTKASDVYSFGVIMWETFRCIHPWVRTSTGHKANPLFPSFSPSTPPEFVRLCRSCLSSSCATRPSFPHIHQQLLVMLAAALAGDPQWVNAEKSSLPTTQHAEGDDQGTCLARNERLQSCSNGVDGSSSCTADGGSVPHAKLGLDSVQVATGASPASPASNALSLWLASGALRSIGVITGSGPAGGGEDHGNSDGGGSICEAQEV